MVLKRPARQVLQKAANDRLTKRRTAVGKINELLHKMSLETLQLKPKDIDKPLLARALRLLARRCVERDQKTELSSSSPFDGLALGHSIHYLPNLAPFVT